MDRKSLIIAAIGVAVGIMLGFFCFLAVGMARKLVAPPSSPRAPAGIILLNPNLGYEVMLPPSASLIVYDFDGKSKSKIVATCHDNQYKFVVETEESCQTLREIEEELIRDPEWEPELKLALVYSRVAGRERLALETANGKKRIVLCRARSMLYKIFCEGTSPVPTDLFRRFADSFILLE